MKEVHFCRWDTGFCATGLLTALTRERAWLWDCDEYLGYFLFLMGGLPKEDYVVVLKKHLWKSTLNLAFTHIQREGNVTLELEYVMINLPRRAGTWHSAGRW